MKRATEEQGTPGTYAEYLSPGSKGMDLALQQYSTPHFTSFSQETPMKPSQVPNLLSHPPPRRMLPLQTPEQCSRDRYTRHLHPHSEEPLYSTDFVAHRSDVTGSLENLNDRLVPPKHFVRPSELASSRPPYTGSSVHEHKPTPKERLGSVQQVVQLETIRFSSSQFAPTCSNNSDTSTHGPSPHGVSHHVSSKSVKNLSNHFPSRHTSRDQETEFKVISSHSGSNNETGKQQDSKKSPQQQHERTSSSKTSNPDLNCTSQKRHREFEHCSENKKLCLQGSNSSKTPTTMPIPGNTPSHSQVSNSSKYYSALERSPKTAENHICTEPEHSAHSSTLKSTHSHSSSSSKHTNKEPSKKAHIDFTDKNMGKPSVLSKSNGKSVKRIEESPKSTKSTTASVPQKEYCKSPHPHPLHHFHAHDYGIKTSTRDTHLGESRKSDSNSVKPTSKPNSHSPSSRPVGRSKTSCARRLVSDDIGDLFTPDPMTYIISPARTTAKPKMEEKIKSPTAEKSPCPAVSCSTPLIGSTSHKTPQAKVMESALTGSSSTSNSPVSLPSVTLKHGKGEKIQHCSKVKGFKSPIGSSSKQVKDEKVTPEHKNAPLILSSLSPNPLKPDTATSKQTALSQSTEALPPERQEHEVNTKEVNEEDPIDVELDLDLSIAYDVDLTQSSISSEEEQLISLREMMERVTKAPDTPEKGTFPDPATPVHRSKTQLLPSTTNPGVYKNSLDQMLIEMNKNKRAKEMEAQLLLKCKEEMLKITEYEKENQEERISAEHQEILQRYSLMTRAIRDVPPGEAIFCLDKFGRLFNQNTLQLRQCMVNPQGTAQKTLLWSSPAQLRLHVNIGLFQEAYNCSLPCPAQVTRFLFKMMSVHSERMLSEKMLQALCDIACSAAYQIVKNESQQFEVWVPSLADVTLVLLNMGVDFVTLYPFENLQPPFTEGDLLDDVYIKTESPATNKEEIIFPEHNCSNIFKYLSYCMGLCPRAYSDDELLMLLTIVATISLDTQCILQSSIEVTSLQYKLVNNIRDWIALLPRICQALTDLTNDHHNMCLLVQLLPDNTRGKALRQHLSLSMISKLLDGTCTYKPEQEEFQLVHLRPYLPRMQPSSLLQNLQKDKEEDMDTLDQQAYYLCSSLLTLTNESSNLTFFPPHQKEQLLFLSSELETYVKCDIRESEKCLYRSKVKDLVARIYTKWQMLLQRTRPLHGQLYDYWQPVENFRSSQEDAENSVTENETTSSDEDENDVLSAEGKREEEILQKEEVMEAEEAGGTEDTSKTEEANELATVELNQAEPEIQPQALDEQADADIEDVTKLEKTLNE